MSDGSSFSVKALRPWIERAATDPRILALYLLGSAAAGTLRPDSDIDIALMPEAGTSISALDRAELAAALSFEIGRAIDIGELSSENLVYAREALLKGLRLYSRNDGRADLRAATLLGMYVRFNDERREVINAYRAR